MREPRFPRPRHTCARSALVLAALASLMVIPDRAVAGVSRQASLARQAAPIASTPLAPYVPDEVLVRFKSATGGRAAQVHALRRATVLRRFEAVSDLYRVRVPSGTSVEDAVRAYRADPSVLYAEPNYRVDAVALPNDPRFGETWGLHNIGQEGGVPDADIDAPEAWELTTGSSDVVVAVIDGGIDYETADLALNMFRNEIECTPNGVDDDANGWVDDCHGIDAFWDDGDPRPHDLHATHVAGTIGARGNDGTGVAGVNWNVRILSCKFLHRGSGSTADAVQCLDYLALMKDRGVNIVASNNSWGSTGFSQALLDAIDAQRARGILFVAAAGNGAAEASGFLPAAYYLPNVITVAATTRTDELASFSNFGATSTHLGAPGQAIMSTAPGGGYDYLNGTSMAAPHVTGVVALLKAQDPGRDWKALRNLVLAGGDDVPALAATVTGKRLNARGSLACSGAVVQSRLRPVRDPVAIGTGQVLPLAALHIDCADPAGDVTVTVQPGGATFDLTDDGLGFDQEAGDGVYSGEWSSAVPGNYTLAIAGSVVEVTVGPDAVVSPNAAEGDRFGWAVAAEGSLLLVGEPGDDTGAPDAGAAHLLDVETGATIRSFYNPDPEARDEFGTAVALSGNLALIGAQYEGGVAEEEGAAYLFDVTTGALLHEFHPQFASEQAWFGNAVTFVNGYPVVGSPNADAGADNAGAVHLYDPVSGALLHTFLNSELAADEGFGYSLATMGSTLVIGAPFDGPASEPGVHIGFVHLYDADVASPSFGTLQRMIFPILPHNGYTLSFGISVATLGTDLVVGDPSALPGIPSTWDGPRPQAGAAFLVDGATGLKKRELINPLLDHLSFFGLTVAGSGDRILVGAPLDDNPAIAGGAVYVFEASTGAPLRMLTSPAPGIGNFFGFALTPADGDVFAGAPQDDAVGVRAGAAYRLSIPLPVQRDRCYKAKAASGTTKLPYTTVTLADALETKETVVLGPVAACNPARQNGSTVSAPDVHLACHKIKDVGGQAALAATSLRALGPVGVESLTLQKPYALCAPSGHGGDPVPSGVDAYKCYRAKVTKGARKFAKSVVSLEDDLGYRLVELQKPLAVCAPVAIDGGSVVDPSTFLTCYQAKDAKDQAPFTRPTFDVASALGSESLATIKPYMACVPSQRLAP